MPRCAICDTAPGVAVLVVRLGGTCWQLPCCLDCPNDAAPAYDALGATVSVRFDAAAAHR